MVKKGADAVFAGRAAVPCVLLVDVLVLLQFTSGGAVIASWLAL